MSYYKGITIISQGEYGDDIISKYDVFTKDMFFDKYIVSPYDEVTVNAVPENYIFKKPYSFKLVADIEKYADFYKKRGYERVEIMDIKTDRSDYRFCVIKCFDEDEEDPEGSVAFLIATWK